VLDSLLVMHLTYKNAIPKVLTSSFITSSSIVEKLGMHLNTNWN